jgi:hypothetical protein
VPPPPVERRTGPTAGVEEAGVHAQGSAEAENPGGAGDRTRTQPRGCWRSSLLQLHLHHGEISVEWQWW